ncbi:Alpha/Beta hydrolase protein [Gongronella butleri]|nr:Alpha/Beta hydrolase protein [Gongronella butleri]
MVDAVTPTLEDAESNGPYTPFHHETAVLPKNWQKDPHRGSLPLPHDIVIQRDVTIKLRDGTEIYADVLRPNDQKPHPVLIPWSPYGKTGDGFFNLDVFPPYRAGVPYSKLSGLEKFESIDPAVWVPQGFVFVQVNARGAYDSQGDIMWWGTQEGRDGYDVIEWAAAQPWSTGKVGLLGNSWLAIAQWFIAAEQPPHLCAIAPWEGASDIYRDMACGGGIPSPTFSQWLREKSLKGRNKTECVDAMVRQYPFYNEYWEDKRVKFEKIQVPAYIVASYTSQIHVPGSFRAFEQLTSNKKWIRVHPHFEWYDLYDPESQKDLLKFFNFYLKGEQNNWESTPLVRMSLLGFNQPAIMNRPEQEYPLARTQYKTFYLHSQGSNTTTHGTLETTKVQSSDVIMSYDSLKHDDANHLKFQLKFDKYTELAGYARMKLWVSCPDMDDMDIYGTLTKLDASGCRVDSINVPMSAMPDCPSEDQVPHYNVYRHVGAPSKLRVSCRRINRAPKDGEEVDQLREFVTSDKLVPLGTVVDVDMGFWPCGMYFEPGESLQLVLSGHTLIYPETESVIKFPLSPTINHGRHQVHMGPSYPSSITLPFIN